MLKTKEFGTLDDVGSAMRRRIVDFLFDNLAYLQSFDGVKIYYDDGQQSIASALHKAIDYALTKSAITYRPASPADYRLSQVTDGLVGITRDQRAFLRLLGEVLGRKGTYGTTLLGVDRL